MLLHHNVAFTSVASCKLQVASYTKSKSKKVNESRLKEIILKKIIENKLTSTKFEIIIRYI